MGIGQITSDRAPPLTRLKFALKLDKIKKKAPPIGGAFLTNPS